MTEVGKVASGTVDALKTQPLALALVVINVLFLFGGGYVLTSLGAAMRAERSETQKFLRELMLNCAEKPQPTRVGERSEPSPCRR